MKLGVSSYAFGWAVAAGAFEPGALIRFAQEHHVPVVQFGDHLPLHRWEPPELDALAAQVCRAGLEVEVGARGLTASHLDVHLGVCRRIGARLLRFVTDAEGYHPSVEDLIGIIRAAVPALISADVTLAIENHDRIPSAGLRRLVEGVDCERVGICLDTANSLGAGEGIHEVLHWLASACVNLHIKEFQIARVPHLMGFTVTGAILGEGMLPCSEVLLRVGREGRCRTAVLETWPPPERELPATLAKEADWAVRSLRTLRAVLDRINNQLAIES